MSKRARMTGRAQSGSYFAMPHSLLRGACFPVLSPRATKLFLDLATQFRGNNNGDLSAAWGLMKVRGWRSRDQLYKAQTELLDVGLIVKTRQGGQHCCNLFALAHLPVDECDGKLDSALPANRRRIPKSPRKPKQTKSSTAAPAIVNEKSQTPDDPFASWMAKQLEGSEAAYRTMQVKEPICLQ